MTDKFIPTFNSPQKNNYRVSFRIFSTYACNANGTYGSIEYCWRLFGECTPTLYITADYVPAPFNPTSNTGTGKDHTPVLPQMDIGIAGLIMGSIFLVITIISVIFSYARFMNKNRRKYNGTFSVQGDGTFSYGTGYIDTE